MKKNRLPDFETLFQAYRWKPIYGCPGRYVLKEPRQYTLKELIRGSTDIRTFSVRNVPDLVCIVAFNNGALISYKKKDGSFVHTLNDTAGFLRKLDNLGIPPGDIL
jgi:hypothetical protein